MAIQYIQIFRMNWVIILLVRKNDMNNHNDNYWLTAGEGILIKFKNDNH